MVGHFSCDCEGYSPVIVCGDVSDKSTLWSDQVGPDIEGEKIEAAIGDVDLSCLNGGSNT